MALYGIFYDVALDITVNLFNGIINVMAFLPGDLDQQYIDFVPEGTPNWNGHRFEA
jgi:hypothetical protein